MISFVLAAVSVFGLCGTAVKAEGVPNQPFTTADGENIRQALLRGVDETEKYPSVPSYIQQDYPDVYYGPGRTVSSHGCGLACLAMIATYLTDTEQSPVVLGPRYASYSAPAGTALVLFDDAPYDLGFTLIKRSGSYREALAALENGQVVVSLQRTGLFTKGGHFIILTELLEDGKIMVLDPNIYNHLSGPRLTEGFENGFQQEDIIYTGDVYWIYAKKTLHGAGCVNGDEAAEGSAQLFVEDFYCSRCRTAQHRRDLFNDAVHTDHSALKHEAF